MRWLREGEEGEPILSWRDLPKDLQDRWEKLATDIFEAAIPRCDWKTRRSIRDFGYVLEFAEVYNADPRRGWKALMGTLSPSEREEWIKDAVTILEG